MIRLITFADDKMSKAAEICCKSGIWNNIDEFERFDPEDIDVKFYRKNKAILDAERGPGYWLWKPYFIDKTLKKMNEGDHLVYADAGVEFINNIRYVIDRMDQDVWLFGNMFQHEHWCKRDVIQRVHPNASYGKQAQASVIVIRNTEKARAFVAEWLKLCQEPGLIDDSPSKTQNHSEFKEHRHDQGILTTLAYRDGIHLHQWPAMYNCGQFSYEKTGYNDSYPILFHHHRARNEMWQMSDDLSKKFQQYFKSKYGI